MGERPWVGDIANAPIDAGGFKNANHDGETAFFFRLAVGLTKHDNLLFGDFADNDPLQFHLDRHSCLTFAAASRCGLIKLQSAWGPSWIISRMTKEGQA